MTTNPDARPEPIAVDEFEGEKVRFHRGKLPAISLEMAEGYLRGSHLRLQVDVRVGPVRYDEFTAKRDQNRGELFREHTLVIEEVALVGALSTEEANPPVGGSASGRVEERDDFELGEWASCYYDDQELEVIHRGGCGACERRAPFGPKAITNEDFLQAAGLTRPEPDAGF